MQHNYDNITFIIYVDMRDNYVDMQQIGVNIRYNYEDMQLTCNDFDMRFYKCEHAS